jgi:hypothetical protein
MRSIPRLLALTALLLLATATGVRGQAMRMSTVIDNMVGETGDTPQARLIFVEKNEDLCVVIAVLTGPTALRAQLFRFSRRVEGDPKSQTIKFELPKKPIRTTEQGDRIQVWEGCFEGEIEAGPEPGAPAVIDVQYHDPRLLKQRAEHAVAFPSADAPQGVDVLKDSAGNLLFREYHPNPDELL